MVMVSRMQCREAHVFYSSFGLPAFPFDCLRIQLSPLKCNEQQNRQLQRALALAYHIPEHLA